MDGLTHLNEYTGETPYPPSKAPTAPNDTLDYKNAKDKKKVMKSFYVMLKEYVLERPGSLLILDDISVLLYNGFELGQVTSFIAKLKSLMESVQGTLLTVMHADEEGTEDVEQDNFIKTVLYGSNIVIQVQPLHSGLARDVHGQIDILHGPKSSINSDLIAQSMHYKILDNSVHFFAKGVSQM